MEISTFEVEYHPIYEVDFYPDGTNHLFSIRYKIAWEGEEPLFLKNNLSEVGRSKIGNFYEGGTYWRGDNGEFPTRADAQGAALELITKMIERDMIALSGQFEIKEETKWMAIKTMFEIMLPETKMINVSDATDTIAFVLGKGGGDGYRSFRLSDFSYDGKVLTFPPILF